MSQGYENMLIWSHFKPICTKMFCGIFTQSFDAFWGHSNILKINCKAVSTTASSICFIFYVCLYEHIHHSSETGFEALQRKAIFSCIEGRRLLLYKGTAPYKGCCKKEACWWGGHCSVTWLGLWGCCYCRLCAVEKVKRK